MQESENPLEERPRAEIEDAAQECFRACFRATDSGMCVALYGARLVEFRGWNQKDITEVMFLSLMMLEAIPSRRINSG